MILVEQHSISKNNPNWKTIDMMCFISKNLYNSTLYTIKNRYKEDGKFLRFFDIEKHFRVTKDENYFKLPTATSQQILMQFDNNIKSYFALLKKWKKNKSSLLGCPKFPYYKDKIKGRNIILFPNQTIRHRDGKILFPKKTRLNPINTKLYKTDKIKTCRIVPRSSHYIIEIVYERETNVINTGVNNSAIDIGVNNLATLTIQGSNSIIINGKPLKSINQYYNKKKGKLQNELIKNNKKYSSKRIQQLSYKRNNKIKDYLHKSSRFIVDYLIEKDVKSLVVGHNKNWKQGVNLGKVNNQNFVYIPFNNFIQMLKYKCELVGIEFIINEESYTSKCSALDLEKICKHKDDEYVGKRIKRGLFQSVNYLINADVNGSLNIGRKVFGDDFINLSNRGFVLNPVKTCFYI